MSPTESKPINQIANPVAEVDGIPIPGVQPNVVVVGGVWRPPAHIDFERGGRGGAGAVRRGGGGGGSGGGIYGYGAGQGIGRGLGAIRFGPRYRGPGHINYNLPLHPGPHYFNLQPYLAQANENANQQVANQNNQY